MEDLFWSTRGDLIVINRPEIAKDALRKGFVRASTEDRLRYKPGSYNPAYDKGEEKVFTPPPPIITAVESQEIRFIEA